LRLLMLLCSLLVGFLLRQSGLFFGALGFRLGLRHLHFHLCLGLRGLLALGTGVHYCATDDGSGEHRMTAAMRMGMWGRHCSLCCSVCDFVLLDNRRVFSGRTNLGL
jgi:hypothetical protein